jgi:hypothetical protein
MDVPTTAVSGPPSPPVGSLGRELAKLQKWPQVVSLVIGIGVGFAALLAMPDFVLNSAQALRNPIPTIWIGAALCTASYVAAVAIIAFLPWLMHGRRDRTILAAHAWIGAREIRRTFGRATAAMNLPTTPAAANEWLASHADVEPLRAVRFEMLLFAQRFDEARALIPTLPRNTPFDEYRAAEALAMLDDQQTGQPDLMPVNFALAAMPIGLDRIEAMTSLAVFKARRLIGRGDWRAPLVEVRPLIPGSDLVILARDMGMPIFTWFFRKFVVPLAAFTILVALAVTFLALG